MKKQNQNKKKQLRKASAALSVGKTTANNNRKKDRKMVTLSECASNYASILANPFTGPLVGVPNKPAQMSKKVRNFAKGEFSTQTSNGFGFVVIDADEAVVNDQAAVYTSVPGASLTTFDPTPESPATFNTAESNSEYTASQIGTDSNQIQFRRVACGIRVKYIGTKLNQGGFTVGFMDPDHNSLAGRGISDILGEEQAVREGSQQGKWFNVLYRAVHNSDFDFSSSLPVWSSSVDSSESAFFMGIFVQAPDSALSATFQWEAYWCYEMIGKTIRGTTPSHVDNVGFNSVHAVSQLGRIFREPLTPSPQLARKMVMEVAKYVAKNTTTLHKSLDDVRDVVDTTKDIINTVNSGIDIGEAIWDGIQGIFDFLF